MKKFKLLTIILIFLNSSIGFTANPNNSSSAAELQAKKYNVTINYPFHLYGLEQQWSLQNRRFIAEKCSEPIRIALQKEKRKDYIISLFNIIIIGLTMYYLYRENLPTKIIYRRLGIQQESQWIYKNQFII
ncbi:MAG: hypothetical protein LBM22_01540 [Endomicrobium sp.]|jgi:hypothetical protein|nr:hypothetical protein [Endomicrobium sp.]